jgi:ParB family chromosome partitioning protein
MTPILERAVASIQVGVRHRKELGDLTALVDSIRASGLLQPLTVTPDGVLICGWRRLEAVKQLGWDSVAVCVRSGITSDLAWLMAERDENLLHKAFDPVEESELFDEILRLEAEDAKRRQATTRFGLDGITDRVRATVARAGSDETENSGPADSAGPSASGDSRRRAAEVVTGKASYERLSRISALRALADDPDQRPDVRELAATALDEIRDGAPVAPVHARVMERVAALDPRHQTVEPVRAEDMADEAAAALARVRAPKRSRKPTAQAHPRTLRSWVLLWRGMDGWDTAYDPAVVATGVSDKEWETFERVIESVIAFRDAGRSARAAGSSDDDAPIPGANDSERPALQVVAS